MPIGLGAAIGIGAAISGGASLIGAKMSSDASKTAASQQEASADKALALQTQIYNDQSARLSPYIGAGTTALDNLMGSYYATPFATQVSNLESAGRAAGYGVPTLTALATPTPSPSMGLSDPNGDVAAAMRARALMPASAAPVSAGPSGPSGGAVSTVQMIAPDGSTAAVPANLVSAFQAKGARVVGGGGGGQGFTALAGAQRTQ